MAVWLWLGMGPAALAQTPERLAATPLLPVEEPPVRAAPMVPPTTTHVVDVVEAPQKPLLPAVSTSSSLPIWMVATGQCGGFMFAQLGTGLALYGLAMLPGAIFLTGPVAVVMGAVGLPLVTAITAVVVGDYLSGDRHSLLWSMLSSGATFWGGGALTLLVTTGLLGMAGYLAVRVVENASGLPFGSGWVQDPQTAGSIGMASVHAAQNGLFNLPGALLLAAGGISAAAAVGLAVVPAIVTTVVLQSTRTEVDAAVKTPRLVRNNTTGGRQPVVASLRVH